jgi:hypothetical protein
MVAHQNRLGPECIYSPQFIDDDIYTLKKAERTGAKKGQALAASALPEAPSKPNTALPA